MEYIHNTEQFQFHNTVVALGKFDGMHKGHQLIFDELIKYKEMGYQAAVFSFDRPPLNMLKHKHMNVIYTTNEKTKLLAKRGIDIYIEHPFTDEFSHLSPEDFVIKVLLEKTGMKVLVVGDDCGFGYGFKLIVIPKLELEGEIVSSTRVRRLLSEGRIEEANRLMEDPFMICGPVVHGNHMGAEVLQMPTANQIPAEDKLLPPKGVYVSRIRYKDKIHYGISNVGVKPTIEGKNPVGVETHLLDFAGDLYGKVVTVEFLTRIREERKFSSIEALKEEMQNNIAYARAWFEKNES